MVIIGETRERLTELMIKIAQAKNLERISLLISILHLLAESDEFETIAGGQAFYQSNESDTLRLNKV
jgi:hypothetical protein